MRLALNEAHHALDACEVPIGAVVVSGETVVGRGHNLVETLRDPTAHAEMQALTAAASTLGGKYLQGCTLYVTVEPCIMCAGAIGWAQVRLAGPRWPAWCGAPTTPRRAIAATPTGCSIPVRPLRAACCAGSARS